MPIRSWRPALLTVIACTTIAQAQSPAGSIHGVVRTSGRRPLAAATVELRNRETGLSRRLETSKGGEYRFSELPPGEYELSVSAVGMKIGRAHV